MRVVCGRCGHQLLKKDGASFALTGHNILKQGKALRNGNAITKSPEMA
jgi:hypothetical protein